VPHRALVKTSLRPGKAARAAPSAASAGSPRGRCSGRGRESGRVDVVHIHQPAQRRAVLAEVDLLQPLGLVEIDAEQPAITRPCGDGSGRRGCTRPGRACCRDRNPVSIRRNRPREPTRPAGATGSSALTDARGGSRLLITGKEQVGGCISVTIMHQIGVSHRASVWGFSSICGESTWCILSSFLSVTDSILSEMA